MNTLFFSADVYLQCDFEQECVSLVNTVDSDNFEWSRKQCCTETSLTGPSTDHTLGTSSGKLRSFFLILNNSRICCILL